MPADTVIITHRSTCGQVSIGAELHIKGIKCRLGKVDPVINEKAVANCLSKIGVKGDCLKCYGSYSTEKKS